MTKPYFILITLKENKPRKVFYYMYFYVCMCGHVGTHVYGGVWSHMDACIEKPECKLDCHSLRTTYLAF